MTSTLDDTHDAALQSWLASANDPATDFPIQNLPFGRFKRGAEAPWGIGVAIGDQVLDLRRAGLVNGNDMRDVIGLAPDARRALRHAISAGLRAGAAGEAAWRATLVPQSEVTLGLPCEIRDYTDFYIGIHHATTVGQLFRPDNPLLPNYKWVPIGYHGRASSINASPSTFKRPLGQLPAANEPAPKFGPSARLDYELELGLIIGRPNVQGESIAIENAEDHLFGVALFNDWSARDIQAWEYVPLGPFLGKSFQTSISAWVTPLALLEEARIEGPSQDPPPLEHLAGGRDWGLDIALEVELDGETVSRGNARTLYWTFPQQLAHATSNGA
ncbi:MAG TPA: fumarylacetoacetate hydrolase family protein, partial [Burkholderiaceae bacterium]